MTYGISHNCFKVIIFYVSTNNFCIRHTCLYNNYPCYITNKHQCDVIPAMYYFGVSTLLSLTIIILIYILSIHKYYIYKYHHQR